MGLLDALFDPSSYNGGGLLGALPSYPWQNQPDAAASAPPASFADRFNAIPNAPQPFVPSGRTFDQAQFSPAMYAGSGASPFDTGAAPLNSPGLPPQFMQQPPQAAPAMASGADDGEDAPAPPPQAGPISVGGYQMPRIGDAAAFTPQAPAQPPAAPAPAVAQPQPAEMGFGDRLGAGFRGAMANASSPLGLLFGGIAGLAGMGKGTPEQQQAKQMGFAANALLQKGVDPVTVQAAVANPEIMKTLVERNFGPQTVTALGNGYVADKNGKITRAYEPEDKIPSGFAKDDKGNMSYIPGGPADPAYQRLIAAKAADPNAVFVLGKGGELYKKDAQGNVTIVHKNESAEEANLSDETVKGLASQYLAGDRTVLQNLGRGAQGAANIVKIREQINKQATEQGLDGKAIVNNFNEQAGALAGQRSIGTRAANISLAANEANNMIPIALDASAKVPRGEWMPWNKMVQAYQTGSSSPELARFVAATNSLVNSYVRAVSPSGVPTDSMREHAYSMLNSAQSPQAYEAVTKIMQDEMKAAMAAPGQVRKELRHEEAPAANAVPVGKGPLAPGAYVWSPDGTVTPK